MTSKFKGLLFVVPFLLVMPSYSSAEEAISTQKGSGVSNSDARSSKEKGTSLLPPVVVSSKGEEESYLEVPARVDVVPAESIESDHPRLINEEILRTPNVFQREVNPLVPAIGIRMPADFNSPYYLMTQDALPVVSITSYAHYSPSLMTFETSAGDLEVLKGPNSILYGSNAVSAVVNLRSPDPSAEWRNSGMAEYGTYNFKKLKVNSSKQISEDDGYAFSAAYTTEDGWRQNTNANRFEAVGKYVHKISSTDTLSTRLITNIIDSKVAGYLNLATYNSNPTSSGLNGIPDPIQRSQYMMLSTEWDHKFSNAVDFKFIPYLRWNHHQYLAFWDASTYPMDKEQSNTVGLRANVKYVDGPSEIRIGVDGEYTGYRYSEFQSTPTSQVPYYYPLPGAPHGAGELPSGLHYDFSVAYLAASPYIAWNWNFAKDWRLDLGVRGDFSSYNYTNNTVDGDCNSALNTGGYCGNYFRTPNRTDSFSNVAPKMGLSYQINPNSSVFGNLGQGFKIPGASSLYTLVAGQTSPVLKPEIGWTAELGYKFDSSYLGFTASVYQIELLNRIVSTQGTAYEVAPSINAGHSRNRGIELGGMLRPVSDITLNFSGALSENMYMNYISGGVSYNGKYESSAPSQIYNARVTYNPGYLRQLTTSLEWYSIGSYWVEDRNKNLQPGYSLFNLRANYDVSKNFSIHGKVLNLFNTKYPTDVANYGAPTLFYRVGAPITAFAGVEYRM